MKKKIYIVSVIIILLLLCFYLYYQNTGLQVTNYVVVNDKINGDLKIVQVSDFHNTKNKSLVNNLVKKIKEQEPDIIVITGDLIDSRRTDVDASIDFIKRIKSVAPIYYVTGNHEIRTSEYEKLESELKKNDVVILEDEYKVIEVNNSKINMIGVNDPSKYYNSYINDNDSDIVNDLLDGIDYNKENYSILLSHRPELFDIYVDNKIDLVFTGHAHGGQIRIPFGGGLYAPHQGFFPKYTSGKFKKEDTTMIVSRGIGNSLFPFRINNVPELVVVEFRNN